jgi:hypothetical protein
MENIIFRKSALKIVECINQNIIDDPEIIQKFHPKSVYSQIQQNRGAMREACAQGFQYPKMWTPRWSAALGESAAMYLRSQHGARRSFQSRKTKVQR